tara:strand:+ start:536 stop:913 length:378 start_codon:yes stop_codon:yes gene_type:complete
MQVNPLRNCRKSRVIEARALIYILLRAQLHLTYKQIGKVFNKTHATVIHSVKEWPYMVKYKPSLAKFKDQIEEYWVNNIEFNANIDKKYYEYKIKTLVEENNLLILKLRLLDKELTELKANQHFI